MGNDCGRTLVARVVRRVCPVVKAQLRWARAGRIGRGLVGTGTDLRRGRVGPGVDSS
jgi:hypothetical protein